MATSLTTSTFSSVSLSHNSLRPIYKLQPASLSFSKPLNFPSTRAMAGGETKINDGAGQIIDGVKEMAATAAGQAVDMKDKAFKGVQDAAAMVGGKAEEGKKSVADTTAAARNKTLDALGVAEENTEKTVSGAWDATKGAVLKKEEYIVVGNCRMFETEDF